MGTPDYRQTIPISLWCHFTGTRVYTIKSKLKPVNPGTAMTILLMIFWNYVPPEDITPLNIDEHGAEMVLMLPFTHLQSADFFSIFVHGQFRTMCPCLWHVINKINHAIGIYYYLTAAWDSVPDWQIWLILAMLYLNIAIALFSPITRLIWRIGIKCDRKPTVKYWWFNCLRHIHKNKLLLSLPCFQKKQTISILLT